MTHSEKQVILTLAGGDLNQGFAAVSAQIGQALDATGALKASGGLPPAPSLHQTYRDWREHYLALQDRLRIQLVKEPSLNQVSRQCFEQLSQQLGQDLNQWLSALEFQRIDQQLRLYLNPRDSIRLILETNCPYTRRLPWHLWSLLQDYPKAELALGNLSYRPVLEASPGRPEGSVRILAILGNANGLDIEGDRGLLTQLPDVQTQFLVEPSRSQLHDALWDQQGWDILFFAGHSYSRANDVTGEILINPSESLTIEQLQYALGAAIARGLQLALFNSCDGLGLAQALAQLSIPQLVVMREPVPDLVAQAFLAYFLQAFSSGQPFYASVRQARQRLQGLEDQYLCASWLPVIYQNPAAVPPTWRSLRQGSTQIDASAQASDHTAVHSKAKADHRFFLRPRWAKKTLIHGAIAALTILLLRSSGLLQPLELFAYDLLLRHHPAETTDPRILVVEVTAEDIKRYGYPLEDRLLAQLLKKLNEFQPRAVGLDMHRAQPRGAGRELLLEQFRLHPRLSTVCWSGGGGDPNYATPPEFSTRQQTQQLAFSDLLPDPTIFSPASSGTVRRQLLSLDPSLGELSACVATQGLSLHLAQEFLLAENRKIGLDHRGNWVLDTTTLPTLPRRFGAYQRLDGLSSQILIHYRAAQPGQHVSLTEVLSGQLPASAVRDRIVLIGTTAPIGQDIVKTPLGEMPGVWVHAHQLSQLLSASLDQRPLIWVLPQWGDALLLLLLGLLSGAVSSLVTSPSVFGRLRVFWGLMTGCIVLSLVSLGAIAQGLFLPLVPSLLVWIVAYVPKFRVQFKSSGE